MPPSLDRPPRMAALERNARRRYQAALAAALESLRRAQARFDEASATIDSHIHAALTPVQPRPSA